MTVLLILACAYFTQLGVKAALALSARRIEPQARSSSLGRVTVVQAVMSGDPQLRQVLQTNLEGLIGARFVWVVDKDDTEAARIVRDLMANHSGCGHNLVTTDEPPSSCNPKLWKLHQALPTVATELLAVVDDDTRVPQRAMYQLVKALDDGAVLATGLPCYEPTNGLWSRLLAEFVNSAAVLTYLPMSRIAEPVTVNGMCYIVRTDWARRVDLFFVNMRHLTDDLAVAKSVRRVGGRITQTTQPHFIRTTVTSVRHFHRLMHRWFVFIRLLIANEPFGTRCVILASGLLPVICLLGALAMAWAIPSPNALLVVVGLLMGRSLLIASTNMQLTGAIRHAPIRSLCLEISQPVWLVLALMDPVIWWRRRKIRVRAVDDFDYLSS